MENDKINQMALYNARHRLMAAREIAEDFQETGKCFADGDCEAKKEVTPKFHKGDWITNGRYVKRIVGINSDWPYYMFEDGKSKRIKDIDKKYHLQKRINNHNEQ